MNEYEPKVFLLEDGCWKLPPGFLDGGISRDRAELFGKPHIRAHYAKEDRRSHHRNPGSQCAICNKPATNAHHVCPVGYKGQLVLKSEWGRFVLLSALFAVCGSGTTGCHNGFHGGAWLEADWVWNGIEEADMWWSGWLLSHVLWPHSPKLYDYGRWEIKKDGELFLVVDSKNHWLYDF